MPLSFFCKLSFFLHCIRGVARYTPLSSNFPQRQVVTIIFIAIFFMQDLIATKFGNCYLVLAVEAVLGIALVA